MICRSFYQIDLLHVTTKQCDNCLQRLENPSNQSFVVAVAAWSPPVQHSLQLRSPTAGWPGSLSWGSAHKHHSQAQENQSRSTTCYRIFSFSFEMIYHKIFFQPSCWSLISKRIPNSNRRYLMQKNTHCILHKTCDEMIKDLAGSRTNFFPVSILTKITK